LGAALTWGGELAGVRRGRIAVVDGTGAADALGGGGALVSSGGVEAAGAASTRSTVVEGGALSP
jgi:hypothetical protein